MSSDTHTSETTQNSTTRVYETTLESLMPDAYNANRGTQRGQGLLEQSLRELGAGRSVLADQHGNLIAGNKTVEAAASMGLEKVFVVETDGDTLVVVKRTDLDLNEEGGRARDLATRDNRIAEVNLDWDLQVLAQQAEEGLNLSKSFNELELQQMYAELQNDTSFLDQYANPQAETANSPGASEAPGSNSGGEEAAPKPELLSDPAEGAITTETTPTAKAEEAVKLLFLLPEKTRNKVTERLNAIKNEQSFTTLAHALCHALNIPYSETTQEPADNPDADARSHSESA